MLKCFTDKVPILMSLTVARAGADAILFSEIRDAALVLQEMVEGSSKAIGIK